MNAMLPDVRHELPGWTLFWARFANITPDVGAATGLCGAVALRVRASYVLDKLAEHPTVAAVRRLFRQAGCDPTRYRPSSEALLRRLLKGEELPAIHPLVDLNNCLSVELAVPACVLDLTTVTPPLVLRAGRPGESMLSMRGDFDLAGKPLLADEQGPFGTPITDSERVKVTAATASVWLVAYLPVGVVAPDDAAACLRRLVTRAPVARLGATAHTPT